MKRIISLTALSLVSSVCLAQDTIGLERINGSLQIEFFAKGSVAIVELGSGGCIVGPFKVNDPDGTVIFELAPEKDVPTGCSKH